MSSESRSLTERLRALAHRIDTLGGNTYVMPEEREDLRAAADQIEADAEQIRQFGYVIHDQAAALAKFAGREISS